MVKCNGDCFNCPYPDVPVECMRKPLQKNPELAKEQFCIMVARKEAGLSQEGLSKLVGRCRYQIYKWETGRARADWERLYKALPTLEKWRKVCVSN